ncbi:uncharacterized protein LOC106169905 isoform X2 [Lingula anatina]|uniref:Uncharacterized protein LOC106169905 isoform X2 n=1 Tax=Lingula anatina TaxID=7574 RepID=A0A2R2MJH2_LINAN|nr:uncharacterized protein LOC106169905 isoform X2 [Lingula anatina]|eukprot:XP_023930349.1 uncharacterized protein LOC106169905 isoform X2 [Lingula anatina]
MSGQGKEQQSAFDKSAETIKRRKVQREVELAHSAYITNSVANNPELVQARTDVQTWLSNSAGMAKKMKEITRRQVEEQRHIPPPVYDEVRPTTSSFEPSTPGTITFEDNEEQGQTPKNSSITMSTFLRDNDQTRLRLIEEGDVSDGEDEALKLAIKLSLKAHKETASRDGKNPVTETVSQTSISNAIECINLDDSTDNPTPTESLECPVIDCEMTFANYSSPQNEFSHHMQQFQHVAFKTFMNFTPKRSHYMCPECGVLFKRCRNCLEHMKTVGHTLYTAPVLVLGYGCPQCFEIFQSSELCKDHIETMNHQEHYYAFQDDISPSADPFPYPAYVYMCMQDKVAQVRTRVHCVDCGKEVNSDKEFRKSISECPTGKCIASSETTLAELFSTFLKGSTCSFCQRYLIQRMVYHMSAILRNQEML